MEYYSWKLILGTFHLLADSLFSLSVCGSVSVCLYGCARTVWCLQHMCNLIVWVFFAGDNAGSHVHCSCGGAAEAVSDGATVDPETAGHDLCQKHTPSPPARQSQGTVVPLTVGLLLLLQLPAIKLIDESLYSYKLWSSCYKHKTEPPVSSLLERKTSGDRAPNKWTVLRVKRTASHNLTDLHSTLLWSKAVTLPEY